jgi:N4-gp56 family major capsid protein
MPGDTTTYGDIPWRVGVYAEREMLKHAEPVLILSKMGATKVLPSKSSPTIKFRRPIPFPVSTVPLAEGVSPTPQKLAYEDVTVTVRQYGAVTEFSDWIIEIAEDDVLRDAIMLHGEQAGATVEQIVYAAVKGGTNVFYANGATRTAVNTPITLNKQRAVVRGLNKQKAKPITRILGPSVNYRTFAVEAAFVAVAHTDLESDIRNLPGFKTTAEYGQRTPISPMEIGSVENVRYVLSPDLAPFPNAGGAAGGTMVSTGGAQADVYPIIYFGMDAFASVPLKGMNSLTPIVVNPKPAANDPLGQRGTVGHKFATAALILNELWQARLEVAVSAL